MTDTFCMIRPIAGISIFLSKPKALYYHKARKCHHHPKAHHQIIHLPNFSEILVWKKGEDIHAALVYTALTQHPHWPGRRNQNPTDMAVCPGVCRHTVAINRYTEYECSFSSKFYSIKKSSAQYSNVTPWNQMRKLPLSVFITKSTSCLISIIRMHHKRNKTSAIIQIQEKRRILWRRNPFLKV